ncbi:hypothetical protein EA770_18120 [Acinetobacter baumannii]|nr:hypothetical protein F7P77_05110 [Acinetobacter courvalinii]RSN79494.1 hypothetical protein EA770_18120 [Acinetobacter baumannii]
MPKNVKQETYSTGLNCLKKVLNYSEKRIKVTIQFKKYAFNQIIQINLKKGVALGRECCRMHIHRR